MSVIAAQGAIELGLIYALVAIGVYLTFRLLDFPDLTVDGSFPLGAAIAARALTSGFDPVFALVLSIIGGGAAGLITAFLAVRFRIHGLLASILTMIALYSINIRIMGAPNLPLMDLPSLGGIPSLAALVLILSVLLTFYLTSDSGLALRATGVNPRMARAQGVRTDRQIQFGLALSNGLIGLSGGLFALTNGFADVTLGTGTIVIGLAAVILGEALYRGRAILPRLITVAAGAVVYRLAVALALEGSGIGLSPSDLNLMTAILVTLALLAPRLAFLRKSA